MKIDPMIGTYMTRSPHSIEESETLSQAQTLMQRHDIRHLPVMRKGQVVGILSDRDVKVAYGLRGVDPGWLPVSQVCQREPYVVDPQTRLRAVVHAMAVKHIGSAIIVDEGKLAGIFTTVDACRILATLIENNAPLP